MHSLVTRELAVVFRLVGIEVIEETVDLLVRIGGHDGIHDVEELDPSTAFLVRGGDLARRHLEDGKRRRGAVALVIVAVAGQLSLPA